jgi:hypothetical protein
MDTPHRRCARRTRWLALSTTGSAQRAPTHHRHGREVLRSRIRQKQLQSRAIGRCARERLCASLVLVCARTAACNSRGVTPSGRNRTAELECVSITPRPVKMPRARYRHARHAPQSLPCSPEIFENPTPTSLWKQRAQKPDQAPYTDLGVRDEAGGRVSAKHPDFDAHSGPYATRKPEALGRSALPPPP